MPTERGKIKADFRMRRRNRIGSVGGHGVQYADIAVAVLGTLATAWIADQLGGRRGYFAALLVAATGATCGWFLPVRVFGIMSLGDWPWVLWSLGGSALSLAGYYLFRNKR